MEEANKMEEVVMATCKILQQMTLQNDDKFERIMERL